MSIFSDVLSFLGPIVGGGIMLAIASSKSKKLAALKEKGQSAKGVVFMMEQESGGGKFTFGNNDSDWEFNSKYPVIRFLTADQEWITAKSSHVVHSLYKEGEAVTVIYNKEDPTEFMIESKLNDVIFLLLQVVGGALIITGLVLFIIKL